MRGTPCSFLGGGVAKGSCDGVASAMQVIGAASMVSTAGRGLIDPADPLTFGACLARPSSAEVAVKADIIVVVGCELAEVDLWRVDLGHRAEIIRVDLDPSVGAVDPKTSMFVQSDGATLSWIWPSSLTNR